MKDQTRQYQYAKSAYMITDPLFFNSGINFAATYCANPLAVPVPLMLNITNWKRPDAIQKVCGEHFGASHTVSVKGCNVAKCADCDSLCRDVIDIAQDTIDLLKSVRDNMKQLAAQHEQDLDVISTLQEENKKYKKANAALNIEANQIHIVAAKDKPESDTRRKRGRPAGQPANKTYRPTKIDRTKVVDCKKCPDCGQSDTLSKVTGEYHRIITHTNHKNKRQIYNTTPILPQLQKTSIQRSGWSAT